MSNSLYWLGIACITYFVSRVVLYGLKGRAYGTSNQLVMAHCVSAGLLFALAFYAHGFDAVAALPYIVMQALWFGVDWLRTVKLSSRSGRRRSRVPTKLVGRVIAILMMLGAAVYGAATFFGFAYGTTSYADIPITGFRQEALYAVGAPNKVRNNPGQRFAPGDPLQNKDWLYLSPSMLVQFDSSSQRIASILCEAPTQPNQGSCYPSLLAVGNSEPELFGRLGQPTSVDVRDGIKTARYPEIGHDFMLERFRIKAIRVYPDNHHRPAKLWRLIRYMLP